MKATIDKRKPDGIVDYLAIALTTWGVGFLPLMPGTFGSMVGVGIYFLIKKLDIDTGLLFQGLGYTAGQFSALVWATNSILLVSFIIIGIWASGRTTSIFGNSDPSEAVVDEVMGMLITLLFIPITASWHFVLAGFLLFRLFDIWKPYPIDSLQDLPGGVGVCADDIVAAIYAGMCLAIGYAVFMIV